MAPATVEIDESNGAVEVVTHGITQSNYGNLDAVHLTASAVPLTPGQNSYEKAQRWHVSGLGGAVSVRAFRFYATPPAAGGTHGFNGSTVQATYDSANHKRTAYAPPATSATRTPEAVPTTPPGSANIGVAGVLAGELLAPGSTDYLYTQIRTTVAAVTGTLMTASYRYEEIG